MKNPKMKIGDKIVCVTTAPDYTLRGKSDNARCVVGKTYEISDVIESKMGLLLDIDGELHMADCFKVANEQ
jgi:hypothetical protein